MSGPRAARCWVLVLLLVPTLGCGDDGRAGTTRDAADQGSPDPAGARDAAAEDVAPDATPTPDASAAPDGSSAAPDGSPAPPDAAADAATAPDPTDEAFDPERVLQVEIELAPADWNALRLQGRNVADILGPGCLDGPAPSPFTWFSGTVTINGDRLATVGVRKKGFLGSLSESKPALRLQFDKYVQGQRFSAMQRMTLNNDQQDPAHVRQCLGYGIFRAAGLPAPRCSFAQVTVNGLTLGIFSHVESVKKAFLRRNFGSDNGHLYEGALSDFRPGWSRTFGRQTDQQEDDGDRADLDAVVAALQVDDARLVAALEPLVALDRFLDHWATEALVGHWDGYASNRNNFYVYADPADRGRLTFIPWGIDGILQPPAAPAGHRSNAESVYANGWLAWRLYQLPELRQRYQDRLRTLLAGAWDTPRLQAEIDRMAELITPYLRDEEQGAFPAALEQVRSFVRTRYLDLHTELALAPPEPPYPPGDDPCWQDRGQFQATFTTAWGSYPPSDLLGTGQGRLELDRGGEPALLLDTGASAGLEPTGPEQGLAVLLLVATLDATRLVALRVLLDPSWVSGGQRVALDWSGAQAMLFTIEVATGQSALLGFVSDGELVFTQAARQEGAAVEGTLQGLLLGPPG